MSNEPIILKKRGEDGTKIVTIRVRENLLKSLDDIASTCNYSRNELINMLLQYGVDNVKIE